MEVDISDSDCDFFLFPGKKGLSGGTSSDVCFPMLTKCAHMCNCSTENFPL